MNTFSSHRLRLALATSILTLVMLTAVKAQAPPPEQGQKPFIEPAEHHVATKVEAFVETQPSQDGQWDTLPFKMPINPVHVALMHTGKVLIVSGSGNDPDNKNFQAAVWDLSTGTLKTFSLAWDMFCNGMVILPDGRPFVMGGNLQYDPPFFKGEPRVSAFDPATETFSNQPNMSGGRWYPTGTVLGNGHVLVDSGLDEFSGQLNRTVQIWTGSSWVAAGTAFSGMPLYPRQHLLPTGKVFESGSNRDSKIYDPVTHTFTTLATTQYPKQREYGTSVLLPLTPANGFKPRVMIFGGGAPDSQDRLVATDTTELIDLSVASPQWKFGPPMANPRVQLNATLLPNGKVVVSGGSKFDEDKASAALEAQLYDPESNTFSSASTMEFPRLYHSNTMLLPDARVVALGGNPVRKVYQPEIEIYSPAYLFNSDGTLAVRPAITGAPSGTVKYGASFEVSTPDAQYVRSVVLIRPGAVTHAFDMEQRLVGLSFTAKPGALTVQAPANGNLAPPGYYLLFILNTKGVPSVAKFVRLSA